MSRMRLAVPPPARISAEPTALGEDTAGRGPGRVAGSVVPDPLDSDQDTAFCCAPSRRAHPAGLCVATKTRKTTNSAVTPRAAPHNACR